MKRKNCTEDMERAIGEYFAMCDSMNEEAKEIVKPYTLSGLLYHIGIGREEYRRLLSGRRTGRALRLASARIEAFIEENMLTGELSVNGGASSLKYNFGWGDKKTDASEGRADSVTVSLSPEAVNLAK